ncbi:MAG: APC family permease [Gammaproteobacteria bacterium]|nr:APC family permease [Gammaproteobacteria bacterium]MDH5653932.1 APC family permease [Gammaproteobacteria bacterium]
MNNQHEVQLKRSLSLTLVTFYGIGTILGAGIYVLVGKVAGYAGMYTLLAFVLASILAGFSAFSYAELAVRYPRSAGEAIYVRHGLRSERLARVVGLLIVLVGAVSTATLLHGFVGYLNIFVQWPGWLVIVVLVLVMTAIVVWGIGQSVIIASLMTVVEISGLLLILWVARDSFALVPAKFSELVPGWDGGVWIGILSGAFIAFYAFIGFEDIVNVAEEVKSPEVNLPRAIIIALVVTTTFYILVSLVSILAMPTQQLAQSDAPLAMLYEHKTGMHPTVITLISLISVLNGALVQIIMASRVLYGMSRQGWLPHVLGNVHSVTHTPVTSTLVVGGVILLFALFLPLLSLAKLTSFITLTIFAMINLALLLLKLRGEPVAGFCVPLWVPVCGFICSSAFVLFQLSTYL